MGLFSWSQNKKASTLEKNSVAMIDKKDKNFIVKAIGLISQYGSRRGDFQEPEYDLDEIKRAAEADSYISTALRRYKQLIYKAGYTLKSDNDKAVDYIKTRFKIMGYMTDKPIDILFQEIADDMVKYSNAFLLKSRVENIGFNVNAKGVGGLLPVGGYFIASPETIRIKRDKHGTVVGYEQRNDEGDVKRFAPTEVIHFYMDREAGNAYGTPRIASALEDVKLLRRIEGNIISLIYRFAIPLYQWKIGIPQNGLQATPGEIDDAKREVEDMALDGIVFTNERTEIKSIGAEGEALDATNYLTYFEKRVFTALGVSEAQMGRSTTSNSADSMESQVHDTVKHIQRVLRIFIENFIISELLMEGGFNPILNSNEEVFYEFNEISLDTKIKIENHEMLKFQQNIHTFEESRTNMGMNSDNVDEERLYANMITKKVALEQAEQQSINSIALANVNAENNLELAKFSSTNETTSSSSTVKQKSNSGGKSGNPGTKSSTPNKDVETRNRPTNQHGTTSVKIKESFSTEESKKQNNHKKKYEEIYKRYEMLRNDIADNKTDIDFLIRLSKDGLITELKKVISNYSYQGIDSAINELAIEKEFKKNISVSLEPIYKEVDVTITSLLNDIKKNVAKIDRTNEQQVKDVFDTLIYRLRFLIEYVLPKAYWYSYIKAGAELGQEEVYVEFNSEEDKQKYPSIIQAKHFAIEDIPAYHSFCNCKVSFKKVV